MESISDDAPSLVLFDHSIEGTLMDGSGSALEDTGGNGTLFTSARHNSNSTATLVDCGTIAHHQNSIMTYFFFIFPVIGFLVLVSGSCLLRKRQVRQDAEAIRRYRERLSAAEAEKRLKEERRSNLIERALVTTKVTFLPKKNGGMGGLSSSFAARGRSSTMETVGSDLDSTVSSSCTALSGMRRGSEQSSGIVGEADEEKGRQSEESAADASGNEQQVQVSQTANKNISSAASRALCEASSIPEGTPLDFEAEACAICLEPYRENDQVSYSRHQNCSHAFHSECIMGWLKDQYRNDCPCCRGPYLHLCVVEDDGDYNLGGSGGGSGAGIDGSSNAPSGDVRGSRAEAMRTTTDVVRVMDPTSMANIATSPNEAPIIVEEEGDDSNV